MHTHQVPSYYKYGCNRNIGLGSRLLKSKVFNFGARISGSVLAVCKAVSNLFTSYKRILVHRNFAVIVMRAGITETAWH